MNRILYLILTLCFLGCKENKEPEVTDAYNGRQRLVVLADMGNEPDEMQQIIHLMTCSNEFDIEGLIAVTGKYLRPGSHLGEYHWMLHPELYMEIIDAYEKVYENLKIHDSNYPEPQELRNVVASGQTEYGIADVGKGKSSEGSEMIIKIVEKDDERPVWIVMNAGSNTLAQALFDYSENHTEEELDAFIKKLRVFENGSQDNAGSWICSEFPEIHWIRSNFQTYAYGGPGWANKKAGLGPHYWKPHAYSTEGQLEWQKEHIVNNHGALGAMYPERRFHAWGEGVVGFMEGGGTIPWMGLVNKGLFDINQPSWGGWSGRFTKDKTKNFWSRHKDIKQDEEKVAPFYVYSEAPDKWIDPQNDSLHVGNFTPVWRWRMAMYNDQICRMDWCTKPFEEGNHHPVAAFNGDTSNAIVRLNAKAGETLSLDASASTDPDNDELNVSWWVYTEAGTYGGIIAIPNNNKSTTSFTVPKDASGKQIHVILEINDENSIASLYDYRRIVIDVEKNNN
ncbi:nucleoside hydrolase-like domain-containing protein [Seonamhaeicola maritimus]|uniref:nucleoside hydrolase-like domain-containing protein n=1 Tax=Seonamhaeicola maritimus TaxID=2591822 RepID=UPI002494D234|nr:nucleoside hydrolase-like domain-containing protein [Seonamhaeicola maritimus]